MSPASEATAHGMTTRVLLPPSVGGFSGFPSHMPSSLLALKPPVPRIHPFSEAKEWVALKPGKAFASGRIPHISPPLSSLPALCMYETSDFFPTSHSQGTQG